MGLRPRKLHELRPVKKQGLAYVWWGKRWHRLGRWDDRNGEPTPEAAEKFDQLRALWRVDPLSGSSPDSDALLVDVWADWLQSPERPRTSAQVTARVQRYLFGTADDPGPHFASRVDLFDGRALLAWQSHLCGLRDEGTTRARLSRDTIRRCVRLIRACLDWGSIQGTVTYEQVYQLSKVPSPTAGQVRENVKRKPVARSLVDPVLPLLSPPLRAAVELLWFTCARPSEVLGLRVGDIRRGGSVMTPGGAVLDLDTLGVWCAILEKHKTDHTDFERVLFFGPRSQVVLLPFLEGRAAAEVVLTGSGVANRRRPGDGYFRNSLQIAVGRACEKAGLVKFTPYQLRHASLRVVQAQFGRDGARAIAGHRVGGATENYVGSDLHMAARIAADLG